MTEPCIFMAGRLVDLAAPTRDMALNSNWWRWFNDANTTRYMQQRARPNTPEAQAAFYDALMADKTRLQLAVLLRPDHRLVGMVTLSRINPVNRSCELSGILGEPGDHGRGLGTEAFGLMADHAFDQLNMQRVGAGTFNPAMARVFLKLGFTEEGLERRAVWKDGAFHDVRRFGLLRAERDARRSGEGA